MWKRLSTLVVFWPAAFSTLRAFAAGDPVLVVRVWNFSHVDRTVVAQANDIARRIFTEAGIETVWLIEDNPANPRKSEPSGLKVQIFAGRPKRSEIKDAFGAALLDTSQATSVLADVFFGNIEEVATTRADEAILLGHVMAHEVGHLLGAAHAPDTVMAVGWKARDIPRMQAGRVRFSASQGERLRAAIALRQGGR